MLCEGDSLDSHLTLQEVENKALAVAELSKALDQSKTAAEQRESSVRLEMERTREGTEEVRLVREWLTYAPKLCRHDAFKIGDTSAWQPCTDASARFCLSHSLHTIRLSRLSWITTTLDSWRRRASS